VGQRGSITRGERKRIGKISLPFKPKGLKKMNEDFLTNATCEKCNFNSSYYATTIGDAVFIVENCERCGAEGQFFLKITEVK
jgi:hypothetical protein